MRTSGRHSKRPGGGAPKKAFEVRVRGLHYDPSFVKPSDEKEVRDWLATLHPIWEQRYAAHNPPPAGQENRWLLRPVYWLGNWQFACLDYYHPPQGIQHRCVRAEPFPPVLQRWVFEIEEIARRIYDPKDLPRNWKLNTCLVNFYGDRVEEDGRRVDTARVGEHKDFEPGPVGSISFGDRALFQFVSSQRKGTRDEVVFQQWLDHGALQIFGGAKWKREFFHRVQRVERKWAGKFRLNTERFETRRVNFTFRYVPEEHIVSYAEMPADRAQDIRPYIDQLAARSEFWRSSRDSRQ